MITHLRPGTTFASTYEVIELIAEGGMGAVYKVRNKELGSYLALKVMQSGLIRDQRMIERFVREAKMTASIESDHVVKVTDAGSWQPPEDLQQPSIPYYVMELLDGRTLTKAIQQEGPFPPAQAKQFFRELCHALAAAHARQIVHRDLKPDNILLARSRSADETPRVKVLDFGIAKVIADAKLPGTVAGTPLWMSPEQSLGGKIGFQTDVWALGLIAFYVLTGQYYWTSTDGYVSPQEMQQLERATKRAGRYGCAHLIPDGFDVWFSRCVVVKPEARWTDAEEARCELLKLLEEAFPSLPVQPAGAQLELFRPRRGSEQMNSYGQPAGPPPPAGSQPFLRAKPLLFYAGCATAAFGLVGVSILGTMLLTRKGPPELSSTSPPSTVQDTQPPKSSAMAAQTPTPAPTVNAPRTPLRVGFLYPTAPEDHGWTAAHDLGRQWVENALKQELGATQIVTFYESHVTQANASEKIRQMIEQKQANVIIGAGEQLRLPILEQANHHAEVRFFMCAGNYGAANVGSFFGRMYQAEYLAGRVAGHVTSTRRIGVVGGPVNAETIRHLNAFTIGVREESPTARVQVMWVGGWSDIDKEKEYTKQLAKNGADVIMTGTDTRVPIETAAKLYTPDLVRDGKVVIGSGKPVYSIGYDSKDTCSGYTRCLAVPYWNWGPLYKRMFLSLYNHSWDRLGNDQKIILEQIKTNVEESVVSLAMSPGHVLDTSFQYKISETVAEMAKEDDYHKHFPFVSGRVMVNGRQVLAEDNKWLTDNQLEQMCWFVDGIVDDRGQRPEPQVNCSGDKKPPIVY